MTKFSFEGWMKACDSMLVTRCGLTSEDLPDMEWYDWYSDGMGPVDAVEAAWEKFNDPVYGGW